MKILICDTLNSKVLEELQSLGECTDISASESKHEDLVSEINDAEVVIIRSSTQLTKEIIEKGDKLKTHSWALGEGFAEGLLRCRGSTAGGVAESGHWSS